LNFGNINSFCVFIGTWNLISGVVEKGGILLPCKVVNFWKWV